ncbi:hypothetical protein [Nonomuraea sp. NPDC048901]|uniref:hypothetical protein n=1 Tax=Nonomuraea sp. NPDC048901 TaxID=3155627 RepID=UPI0033D9F279
MSTETTETRTVRPHAVDPRKYELWDESLPIARRALDEAGLGLTWQQVDALAETLTDALLAHFVTTAEADSSVVFGMDGTGPWCSWCGRIPGPRLPKDHDQYGVFCDCRRQTDNEDINAEVAGTSAESGGAA